MKISIYASIFAAATSFVAAQNINISDVPSCALSCVIGGSPAGCSSTDYGCWCSDNTWLSSLADCVRPACPSETDQAALVSMAQGLCGAYSVTISSDILASATPAPSGSNTSNATVSATATPTESASASETSTGAADRIMAGSGLMAAAAGVAMLVL